MRYVQLVVVLAALMVLSQGCSSIIAGSDKTVSVVSNPSGAKIEVFDSDGKQISSGTTPFVVSLKRGSGFFKAAKYEFKGSLPGQPVRVVGFKSGINPWYWGNILFGGFIGMLIVDPLTGAMWEPPAEVNIDLLKSEPPTSRRSPDDTILRDMRGWSIALARHFASNNLSGW